MTTVSLTIAFNGYEQLTLCGILAYHVPRLGEVDSDISNVYGICEHICKCESSSLAKVYFC